MRIWQVGPGHRARSEFGRRAPIRTPLSTVSSTAGNVDQSGWALAQLHQVDQICAPGDEFRRRIRCDLPDCIGDIVGAGAVKVDHGFPPMPSIACSSPRRCLDRLQAHRPVSTGAQTDSVVSMLQWFQRLMPRQELFFPLFERHAEVLVAGARALRDMLKGDETSRRCREVMAQELKADDITREVMVAIRTSFITPFDRADIKNLITSMDVAIDQMQATAKAIVLFEMTSFEPEMQAMADAVVECAELVQRAVPLLASVGSNATTLNELCLQITRIEERADDIHDRGLKRLYQKAKGGDPMEFVRGNEIYGHLEESVDRFDDVANEIQGIVIEQV